MECYTSIKKKMAGMKSMTWKSKSSVSPSTNVNQRNESSFPTLAVGIERHLICITGEDQSWENYGLWRQEQKMRAARLEKQLKARWALEELIEEQLNRFNALYNQKTMVPTRLRDVSQILMPKGSPAHELATLAWLGDWRPSAVLDLLRSLARSSSSLSSSLSDTAGIERILNQLIHDIRIEEAVIDEEMTEIQATCILHLPFAPIKNRLDGPALAFVQSEFKKIHRVITKAQKLRFKALQLVVKKVLNQTDAAEFLVAFARIQDLIHQFATQHKLRKGPVSVPVTAP
ncbi:hypothetical protein RJ640_021280 [Escallonia rubra]|uniref:DOG1 domain-containing protein n=1 Tax=Escallonia rubra TaxID=112253 RepID=A0AA88S2K1_9ASTE|nr:hypothetical protein RJ640_021280 [Escallonia rubra]